MKHEHWYRYFTNDTVELSSMRREPFFEPVVHCPWTMFFIKFLPLCWWKMYMHGGIHCGKSDPLYKVYGFHILLFSPMKLRNACNNKCIYLYHYVSIRQINLIFFTFIFVSIYNVNHLYSLCFSLKFSQMDLSILFEINKVRN